MSCSASRRSQGRRRAVDQALRLPLTVAPVFLEWLGRCYPDRAARIEGRIRGVRGGRLNSPDYGERMSGGGAIARQIADLFKTFTARHGLDGGLPPLDCSRFRRPVPTSAV